MPDYEAFLRLTFTSVDYREELDRNGFNRDSVGFEVDAGAALDLGGLVFGNVFAGYLHREFDDPEFDTVSGPGLGADLTWTPTGLTTVTFGASRSVEATTLDDASSFVGTRAGLRADHELLRNLILSGFFEYQNRDYQGITRNDHPFRTLLGARYLLNRHLYVNGGYDLRIRDSNLEGEDYLRNRFFISLETQL